MARKKKQKYYGDKRNSKDSKTLYSVINKLLDKEQVVILPNVNSERELANSFMKYFIDKIEKIRATFEKTSQLNPSTFSSTYVNNKLSMFEAATLDEIKQIL